MLPEAVPLRDPKFNNNVVPGLCVIVPDAFVPSPARKSKTQILSVPPKVTVPALRNRTLSNHIIKEKRNRDAELKPDGTGRKSKPRRSMHAKATRANSNQRSNITEREDSTRAPQPSEKTTRMGIIMLDSVAAGK